MNVHDHQGRQPHERSLELAAMAIDGALTAAETRELDDHLAGCPTCARRAAGLHVDARRLGEPLALLPAARVDAAVSAAITGRARPQRLLVLAAATLLLLAMLGAVAAGAALLLRDRQAIPDAVVPSPPVVVADVSPKPTTNPSQPLVTTAWSRGATVAGMPAPASFEGLGVGVGAGFAGGYVAIGPTRTIWFSEDALTWMAAELPFPESKSPFGQTLDANVDAIASNGREVMIVGAYSHEPCSRPSEDTGGGPLCPLSPISWISDDGKTWRSSHPWPGPDDPPGYSQGSEFVAVWPVPGGGWDAALNYWEGESLTGQDIFHSDDGVEWTALEPVPTPQTAGHIFERNGFADASARRVAWQVSALNDDVGGFAGTETWLTTSPDGQRWSAVDGFPAAGASVSAGLAPGSGETGPRIVAGGTSRDSGRSYTPTVWVSGDLASWTTTALPTSSAPPELCTAQEKAVPCSLITRVDALIDVGDGYLAVGSFLDDGYGYAGSQTWSSQDGITWVDQGPSGFAVIAIADGPAGLIGIGVPDREEGVVAVWRLEAASAGE